MSAHAPRSNYAARLSEHPGLVLAGDDLFNRRGRWPEVFRERIGSAFGGRVIFEIGCFDAALLARVAARYPGVAFVGIDWKCKAICDGATRIASQRLKNVILLRGRAQEIGRIFGADEVDEVWAFHPDPCDREKELPNRLVAEPFLLDAYRVLKAGTGRFCLKTDHPGYYQSALGLLGLPQPPWFEPARLSLQERRIARRIRGRASQSTLDGPCAPGVDPSRERRRADALYGSMQLGRLLE